MKTCSFLILLINALVLTAQDLPVESGTTWAVVIGISDYQDEGIPDLRYAHRDAELFANYLVSNDGRQVPIENIILLTDSMATAGRIAEAFEMLLVKSKKGDEVIIYFSGHGDVESKTLTQPGFLLCWDAPARIYQAGGAFPLSFLQDFISTLSVQNKAKVIVITDTCRSGKLSGSVIGGAQRTSAHLAKQYTNETKILSCQPDEYSIEGKQWGGGHGVFTYFLVKGLKGAADMDGDKAITANEMMRYLEDSVAKEVSPQNQTPLVIGSRTTILSSVSED